MPRHNRQDRLLSAARSYVHQHLPELQRAPLRLHPLDGPPGSPRYAVTVEACFAEVCPRNFPATVASSGQCGVLDCPLRRSLRLLLDHQGVVLQATTSGIHWS
jgi:hypothetical protein